MADYPSTKPTALSLLTAVNNKVTTLTSAIDDSTLTIPVVSTTGFPAEGYISIDTEIIHYTSVGASQFNADARGADGSVAAAHSDTTQVSQNHNAAYHNLSTDELVAIAGDLIDALATLDDGVTPAATAGDIKIRIDQIVTQIKAISGEADWTTAIGEDLASVAAKVAYFQAIQGTTNTQTVTSSTSFVDSALTASITPSSSSHRVKITIVTYCEVTTGDIAFLTIKRASTDLGGSNGLARLGSNSTEERAWISTLSFIDSPATASAVTYTLRGKAGGANTLRFGGIANTDAVIILEEIT